MPESDPSINTFAPDLRGRKLDELADVLRRVIQPVIDAHVESLRRHLPIVRPLERDEVVNDLSLVLMDIVEAFVHDGGRDLELRSPAHGIARFTQKFEVEHLGVEYTLLRGVLATQVRQALGRSLTDEEADALHAVIDYINSRVTIAFEQQKEKQIRLEADSMSRFLSALAHDLRNSLNGAMLTMQMVAHSARDAIGEAAASEAGTTQARPTRGEMSKGKLQELLHDVEESRHVMETTIDAMTRLLEAERLRVGTVSIRPEEVLLGPLVESATRSAWRGTPGAASEDAKLRIEVPEGMVIRTDYALLSTVLLNLVSNAIKYGNGKPVIVKAQETDEGGWRIDVIDHGLGIAPEQQARLFQEFNRGGRTQGEGLGLGLFTARRAAELMGATLSVESEVDGGTTFTLRIPRDPPVASNPQRYRVG